MIRKQNSDFVTAFTSESGGNLKNSDCFAFVELEGFACYIVADGIDDVSGANSAKLCVDAVVSAFTEAPSMKKSALKKYMKFAHKALLTSKSKEKLKASVTILVHNYAKMRYCQAGNVRIRLYRNGFLKLESKDQSLSSDLVDSHKLEKDKLTSHAERHNLYSYVGQEKALNPYISKKIKLTSSDAISLTSRGFWENVDEGELQDLFQDAGTDPKETVRTAEDMLLSKQPENLRAFTFVSIFVNKTFIDPTRRQKWKKFFAIVIPILIIVFIISLILYFRWRSKQNTINSMNTAFQQSIAYLESNNYVRSEGTLEEAITYANKVSNTEVSEQATQYLILTQRIISADESLAKSDFHSAQIAYVDCLDLSRNADLYGIDYAIEKLEQTQKYIEFYDLIALGDTLTLNYLYDEAEHKYMEAKILAGSLYYDTGRQAAMDALTLLYEAQKSQAEDILDAATALVELETSAANFMAQGDISFGNDDLESALVFYSSALQKYEELSDSANYSLVEDKIAMTKAKQAAAEIERATAESYVALGQSELNLEKFSNAKRFYLLAKEVYDGIGDSGKSAEMDTLVEIANLIESTKLEEIAETEAQLEIARLEEELARILADLEKEEEESDEESKEDDLTIQDATSTDEFDSSTLAENNILPEFGDDVIILG